MNLKNLVTTYEQSRRIQELGFESENIFVYSKIEIQLNPSRYTTCHAIYHRTETGSEGLYKFYDIVGCLTAEELGEILPEDIEVFKDGKLYQYRLRMQKSAERREVYYYDDIRQEYLLDYIPDRSDKKECFILGPTLAQAMGDMLIYLLENNLLPTNETDATS